MNAQLNRREFISTTAVAAAAVTGLAAASGSLAAQEERKPAPRPWPVGCFNRPWAEKKNWDYDVALKGIKEAGYDITGLLTRSAKEPLIGSDATPEYLEKLKQRIEKHRLKPILGALRLKNDLPLDDQIKDARKQIDNGKVIGIEYLLTFGADKPEHFENYYKLMRDTAAYAQQRMVKVVLKPHGGASGAAEEIIRCLDKVNHTNFKVWFDAGNIIYYTGKDPVEELKPVLGHVTGLCAKDCDAKGGNVWLEFGKGKVNFPALFRELKRVGFDGPVMMECCERGETPEEVTAHARKNREYIQQIIAAA